MSEQSSANLVKTAGQDASADPALPTHDGSHPVVERAVDVPAESIPSDKADAPDATRARDVDSVSVVGEKIWGRSDRVALVALIVMAAFALAAFIFATVQVS